MCLQGEYCKGAKLLSLAEQRLREERFAAYKYF